MRRFSSAGLLLFLIAFAHCKNRGNGGGSTASNKKAVAPIVVETKPGMPLAIVPSAGLCTTQGQVTFGEKGFHVEAAAMRAVVPGSTGNSAQLQFAYEGASAEESRLGSGQLRRQLGLKLKAQDGCNLVYVMWRIEPGSGIEVSIKRNPGDHRSDDCGNAGYEKIRPERAREVAPLLPGSSHSLQAEIRGDELLVWVDGMQVWEGRLGGSIAGLDGPAGIRSDNVKADFSLFAEGVKDENTPVVSGNAVSRCL